MKIILKEIVYFEIEVGDGTDRNLITETFRTTISPQFEELLAKLKFDKNDEKAFKRLTGKEVKIRLLTQRQFIEDRKPKV